MSITLKAEKKKLFYDLLHEGMHAWDHNVGNFNRWDSQ